MIRIRLYNEETARKRELFAAVLHELLSRQYPDLPILEPSAVTPFPLVGTEHLVLLDNDEIVYARSYLAISTSPESGINRRLNRIVEIPERSQGLRLARLVFALGIECPRSCLGKVENVSKLMGNQGIQFELWEAKDVRRQIAAHLSIVCPAFELTHLRQLAAKASLSCEAIASISGCGSSYGPGSQMDAEDDRVSERLGTVFISYASEDAEFVDRLVAALDRYAAKVWYAKREILVGESIAQRVSQALGEASALIAVLSSSSVDKPWVLRELNSTLCRQLQSAGVTVLPVLIEKCSLPPLLADMKYADFTQSFEAGLNDLIAGLQGRRLSV